MAKEWYVIHTLSAYEAKIETKIRELMEDDEEIKNSVFDVKVPQEDVTELKNGKKRNIKKKFLPGYMLIEMDLSELNWKSVCYKIKRINGVTGFLGSVVKGVKPIPILKDEMREILQKSGDLKQDKSRIFMQQFEIGEAVKIIGGPFDTFSGKIEEVITSKSKLRVTVGIFGRATAVEVDFSQVEKI